MSCLCSATSVLFSFLPLLLCLMLPPHNNFSGPNVDASSSCSSLNTAPHKQVAPSLRDHRTATNQPLVDWPLLSVDTFPDIPKPPGALSNLVAPTTSSRSTHSTSPTTNSGARPDDLIPHEFVLQARSDGLSFQQQSILSQHRVSFSRYHSALDIRTVATQVDPLHNSVRTQYLPPITGADQNASPVLQCHPTFSDPFNETIADARPGPTGFVAIPSSTAREVSFNEVWTADVSESRAHVQRITDGRWKEDAKGILIFTGIFSAIVASFIIESYKMLSPDFRNQTSLRPSPPPAASIIVVNIMWLILRLSLVLNIISALFATLTLRWTRRYTQLPQVSRAPRGRLHSRSILFLGRGTLTYDMNRTVAMTIMLLHLSVFLFLVGLVIFFFTINKIVAAVVSIAVGLFGVVYFTLSILSCIDRSCPYRTPLSDAWWSQRERVGHT